MHLSWQPSFEISQENTNYSYLKQKFNNCYVFRNALSSVSTVNYSINDVMRKIALLWWRQIYKSRKALSKTNKQGTAVTSQRIEWKVFPLILIGFSWAQMFGVFAGVMRPFSNFVVFTLWKFVGICAPVVMSIFAFHVLILGTFFVSYSTFLKTCD